MSEQPILDLAITERLHGWGGVELVDKLISLFLENTPAKMAEIRDGLTTGEIQRIERAAHSLKSSAGNLGASRMHYLAAEMEELAAAEEESRLPELVSSLEAAHTETCSQLKALQSEEHSE